MGESSSEEAGGMDKLERNNSISRAMADDDTALLLSAVERFRNVTLGRLRKGSEASRILDQEMSTRLLHLACRHDAVECARLLLDGGNGITASLVDARDQLMRTALHIAAETHSARCIQLLLSRNARTDLRLIIGRPLVALEIALMSRRVQVDWSPENSVEDLLAHLQQKDLKAVQLLAEKTREVGEVAYRYAMEGRVTELAMLLLVAEDKISATVSVVIDGVRTKRSIYNSVVDEVLSIGDASARDGNERRKALLCEIQLLIQFGASSWRDRNIDKRTLPPLLRAAKAGDMHLIEMLLMGDVDVNETDPEGNTALHWCLSSSSTQDPRIVWLLLKNGARVFQGNKLGLTPVHSAAATGNYKALQTLLLHAQDCVDIPSKTKETPLFLAVKNGSLSCVQLLLRSGANPKSQNLRKQRPIDMATSQDIQFLLNSANVAPLNNGFQNRVITRKRSKELLNDYDKDDLHESYIMPKSHSAPKQPLTPVHSAAANRNSEVEQDLSTLYVSCDVGWVPLRISLSEQVIALKNSLSVKIGYPVLATSMRIGCKILENTKKLSSYGLLNNSVVQAHLKLLGGQPPAKKAKLDVNVHDVTLEAFTLPADPDCPLPALVVTKYITGINEEDVAEESHDLSLTGRRFGKRIVAEFKKARLARETWGGQIGLTDFRARNGELILTKPSRSINQDEWKVEWKKDCAAQARILRALFMKDGKETPYMKYLVLQLEGAEAKWGWGQWFCTFQTTNLAFKPSHRRLHAPQDIWRYFENLKTKADRDAFEVVLDRVTVPEMFLDYMQLSKIPAFIPTLDFHIREHNRVYPDTALGCLLLTRNYGTHGKLLDWLHTELAIPMVLKEFVSAVIREFLKSGYDFGAAWGKTRKAVAEFPDKF